MFTKGPFPGALTIALEGLVLEYWNIGHQAWQLTDRDGPCLSVSC